MTEKREPGSGLEESPHRRFFQSLRAEEVMLLTLRDELYNGSWNLMLDDLRDRLDGRPYIFKLVNRIEEDIERIGKLRAYEERHEINLSEFAP